MPVISWMWVIEKAEIKRKTVHSLKTDKAKFVLDFESSRPLRSCLVVDDFRFFRNFQLIRTQRRVGGALARVKSSVEESETTPPSQFSFAHFIRD